MSILDDEDLIIAREGSFIIINHDALEKFMHFIEPLLHKLQESKYTERMPRLGFEVNSTYSFRYSYNDNFSYDSIEVSIKDWVNYILKSNGEKELLNRINYIDCKEVTRMGVALDFVLTAMHGNNPIILIENITELPSSPRRDDIEQVLIHSWAKDEFLWVDEIHNTRPHIVIFTCKSKNEIQDSYFPVWQDKDGYDWHGNIMKDFILNGTIDLELYRQTDNFKKNN